MKKYLLMFFVFIIIFDMTGCAVVTVRSSDAHSATEPSYPLGGTYHRFLWGYLNQLVMGDYKAEDCPKLQRVSFESNWWESIVTVLTVGLYAPIEVRYLCATNPTPNIQILEPSEIQPIYWRNDTLTTLWVNGLRQTSSGWEWDAWFTNPGANPVIGVLNFSIAAQPDSLARIIRDVDNQIDYTIRYINENDTSLHVHKLPQ